MAPLATKTHCSCGSIWLLEHDPGVDDVALGVDLRFEVAAAAGRRLEREDLLAQVFRLVRLVVDVAGLQLPLLRQRRGVRITDADEGQRPHVELRALLDADGKHRATGGVVEARLDARLLRDMALR